MIRRKSYEFWAILIGTLFLIYRTVAPFTGGLNRWQDISLMNAVFSAIPVSCAVTALYLGRKFNQREVGLVGFLCSSIFLPIAPAIVSVLVILYATTTKPVLLSASWTGITALVCAIIPVFCIITDSPFLDVAAGAVIVLILSAASALFLLISLPLWVYWLLKARKNLIG